MKARIAKLLVDLGVAAAAAYIGLALWLAFVGALCGEYAQAQAGAQMLIAPAILLLVSQRRPHADDGDDGDEDEIAPLVDEERSTQEIVIVIEDPSSDQPPSLRLWN